MVPCQDLLCQLSLIWKTWILQHHLLGLLLVHSACPLKITWKLVLKLLADSHQHKLSKSADFDFVWLWISSGTDLCNQQSLPAWIYLFIGYPICTSNSEQVTFGYKYKTKKQKTKHANTQFKTNMLWSPTYAGYKQTKEIKGCKRYFPFFELLVLPPEIESAPALLIFHKLLKTNTR